LTNNLREKSRGAEFHNEISKENYMKYGNKQKLEVGRDMRKSDIARPHNIEYGS